METNRDNPLATYFYQNRKRIIHKWTHYFDVYHRYFQRFVNNECVVVEIGVSQGGSLQMWKHYFGEKARVYGIDINPECKQFEEERIEILIGDQSDRTFLKEVRERIPRIDLLIDDGGHTMEQQMVAFEELFDHISEQGLYVCEDTHTSYWDEYGGGYRRPGTFVEYIKGLIDQLHGYYIFGNKEARTPFTTTAHSIHFYNSIVVIEKLPFTPLMALKIGDGNPSEEEGLNYDLHLLKLDILGVTLPEGFNPLFFYRDLGLLKGLLQQKYEGGIWPESGETMIGYKRLSNLEYCVRKTIENNIPGDLIETGVWRGGACILMRAILKMYQEEQKRVWVADSFEGLPPPDPLNYPEDEGINLHQQPILAVSLEEVKANFDKYGLLDNRVQFIKGWFKDTLKAAPINKLSILRLDGDLYESTMDALFYLYPKLSVGGYCIIDDWGAVPACRKAVEDYRRVFGIETHIEVIDWTGVFWKKEETNTSMDRSEFLKQLKTIRYGAV